MKKILFITKKRQLVYSDTPDWNSTHTNNNASGLKNSVTFVVDMINTHNLAEAKWVDVVDNNCIDREVTSFRPDVVVVEALWVVPEKFKVLAKLHPAVQWVVRLHSEIPFLANEGIAMDWLGQYAEQYPTVKIAANSHRAARDLQHLYNKEVLLLPNYYPLHFIPQNRVKTPGELHISCFGAIRPFKNHVAQAMAAIEVADSLGVKLFFHVNGTRKEQKGDNNLKNLIGLFEHTNHTLVNHDWLSHDEFIEIIRTQIDLCMQVSFTETYNIVAADHIQFNIPVVGSKEIPFISPWFTASATSIPDMVRTIKRTLLLSVFGLHTFNYINLKMYNRFAKKHWAAL